MSLARFAVGRVVSRAIFASSSRRSRCCWRMVPGDPREPPDARPKNWRRCGRSSARPAVPHAVRALAQRLARLDLGRSSCTRPVTDLVGGRAATRRSSHWQRSRRDGHRPRSGAARVRRPTRLRSSARLPRRALGTAAAERAAARVHRRPPGGCPWGHDLGRPHRRGVAHRPAPAPAGPTRPRCRLPPRSAATGPRRGRQSGDPSWRQPGPRSDPPGPPGCMRGPCRWRPCSATRRAGRRPLQRRFVVGS
jgi:hypothetical protein